MHRVETLHALAGADIDAVQFGPVFDTASKRGFGAPAGLDALAKAANLARHGDIPTIAVGGITVGRMRECHSAGAAAVSVIGAIWDATDIEAAAAAFVA
jgi:thiamine-phosphate pyrophosphorylase